MDCFTSPYGHRGKAVEGGGHAYPEPESSAKPGPSVPTLEVQHFKKHGFYPDPETLNELLNKYWDDESRKEADARNGAARAPGPRGPSNVIQQRTPNRGPQQSVISPGVSPTEAVSSPCPRAGAEGNPQASPVVFPPPAQPAQGIGPAKRKDQWTRDEIDRVFEMHDERGLSWARIHEILNRHTPGSIRDKYHAEKREQRRNGEVRK